MPEEKQRLPLEELIKTPEFQQLTGKQKLWVNTYIASGEMDGNYDTVIATQTAYKCQSRETARVMSYSISRNIHIVEVLNRYFNRAPIDEFLQMLDRAIRNKHLSPSQLGALKLKAAVLGFGSRIPDDLKAADAPAESKQKRKSAAVKAPAPGPAPKSAKKSGLFE